MVDLKHRGNFISLDDWPMDLVVVQSRMVMKKEEHDPTERPEREMKSWFDCPALHFSRNAWASICQQKGKMLTREADFDIIPVFDESMPKLMWLH